jgi:hypothetical protein
LKKILLLISIIISLSAEPFFDNDNTTQYAPSLPNIEAIDKEVLSLCGGWGEHIDAIVFKRWLKGYDKGRLLDELYRRFKKDFSSKEHFLDSFVDIWFKNRGFEHIFCGEPKKGNYLGGLHFFARYHQAYQNGWAKLTKHKWQKAKDNIYKIGVEFKNKKNILRVSKNPKSYNSNMNAKDILIEATKAYLYHTKKNNSTSKKAYNWYINKTKEYNKHKSKIVIKNRSIITFYPIN